MSEPTGAEIPSVGQAHPALRASPLARWLAPTSESRLERIPCADIEARSWPEPATGADLPALRLSIRQRGIVEPLLLRPLPGARFQVVLGARRLEAARALGLTHVPAIVRELDEAEAALVAIWNALPRLGGLVEAAARLAAAGASDSEIALLLGSTTSPAAAAPPADWPLRSGSAPLRFAGAATPVHALLDAVGSHRSSSLAALLGVDHARLAA